MIKETFFSMPRFVNLCRKEIMENWKSNILRLILLYGIMAVVMIWAGFLEYYPYRTDSDRMWPFLLIMLMWALWGFGCLGASFTMEKMKSKTGRLSMLMVPATSFEKFFSRWLLFTVVYLVVFLIAYRLADYTRVLIFSLIYPDITSIAPVDLGRMVGDEKFYTLFDSGLHFSVAIVAYFFTQSCFVLGSAIWPKNSFLKTFAVLALIIAAYTSFGALMVHLSGVHRLSRFPLIEQITQDGWLFLLIAVFAIFTLFNWVLAYFRFKEAEIINRM